MKFNVYVDLDYWLEKLLGLFYLILALIIIIIYEPLSVFNQVSVFPIIVIPVVLAISIIFVVIFILYLDFNYIEITINELRFKWFKGEKSVRIEDISEFHQLGKLGSMAPLYKIDKVRVFTATTAIINAGIISTFLLPRISRILYVVFMIMLLITIGSVILPARIGRKVFAGLIFSDVGYFIGAVLIDRLHLDLSLSMILILLVLIASFSIGYYLGSSKRWIYDYIIIRALINNRERTIILNGRVRES